MPTLAVVVTRPASNPVKLWTRFEDALGEFGGVVAVGHIGLQNGEFVAAEPRQHVGFAHMRLQALRDQLQESVAGRMAERSLTALNPSRSRRCSAKSWSPRRARVISLRSRS